MSSQNVQFRRIKMYNFGGSDVCAFNNLKFVVHFPVHLQKSSYL